MVTGARFAIGLATFGALAWVCPAGAADMATKSPPIIVPDAQQQWQVTFNSEVQYYSWTASQGYPHLPLQAPADPRGPGKGSQTYVPIGLQVDGVNLNDFEVHLLVRSGYVTSNQTTGGGLASGSVSTATDTTVGTTIVYNGINGVQPFVSVNVNAPTGTSVLLGNAAFARPDPDVAGVPTFGEGWNVGPTLGFNVPITAALVASISGGYTNRGAYNRESVMPLIGPQGTNRIDPGDDWTVSASLAYNVNGLTLSVGGTHVWETKTTIDAVPVYRLGQVTSISGGAGYAWTPQWSSQLTASFTHIDRNLAQNLVQPPVFLVPEGANSNSNITQVQLSTTYTQGAFAIGPIGRFTFRDHNDWDPTLSTFLPAKTIWAAGGMVSYSPSQQLMLTLRGERRWLHEDNNPDKLIDIGILPGSGFPPISSHGWMVAFAGTIKF